MVVTKSLPVTTRPSVDERMMAASRLEAKPSTPPSSRSRDTCSTFMLTVCPARPSRRRQTSVTVTASPSRRIDVCA